MPSTICRHIKTNGARCGSPALTQTTFCYFHHGLRKSHAKPQPNDAPAIIHSTLDDGHGNQRNPLIAEYYRPVYADLDLPPLEDRESVQIAISMVVGALAANRIDPKRASMLLYALQVASSNCNRLNFKPDRTEVVLETVIAPSGTEQIAPDVEPKLEILLQQFLSGTLPEDDHDEDCDCDECEEAEDDR